jgi:hypothetical protein
MMRRTARLQTNKARAKGGKEGQQFFPAQRFGNNNLTRSVTGVMNRPGIVGGSNS